MVTSVVGVQWGDEGKGRIVDYLAQNSEVVVRYQGGDNAGHTVENDYGKFALHIVPSGIFNRDAINMIGAGCVVNFQTLERELKGIPAELAENLFIDIRSHVIFPFHKDLDGAEESSKSEKDKIGTTKCGIGPCYSDKVSRIGLRSGDLLLSDELLEAKLRKLLDRKNKELAIYGMNTYSVEDMFALCRDWRGKFGSKIKDCLPILREKVGQDKRILLEGQLGIMRDIDWGIYPYCTSSSTTVGGACALSGIPFSRISKVVGVCKAYTTSVGGGPFVSELHDDIALKLRDKGHEYGATTGRPRRCGWADAVAVSYSCYLNSVTDLALTKLDILDDFDEIKVAVAYKVDGKTIDYLPSVQEQERAECVYKVFKGWKSDTSKVRKWDDLPENAKVFVKEFEKLAGVPVTYVSVGPERDQLIVL